MEVTIDILKERFDEYNEKYFDSKLKKVKFGFIKKGFKGTIAQFEFRIDKNRYLRDASIKINKGIVWYEERLRRALLHEMVHLSLTQKYKKDKHHGLAFIRECKRIEENYGVKISHCWMKFEHVNKEDNIHINPLVLCYNIASFIKFRIIQKLI